MSSLLTALLAKELLAEEAPIWGIAPGEMAYKLEPKSKKPSLWLDFFFHLADPGAKKTWQKIMALPEALKKEIIISYHPFVDLNTPSSYYLSRLVLKAHEGDHVPEFVGVMFENQAKLHHVKVSNIIERFEFFDDRLYQNLSREEIPFELEQNAAYLNQHFKNTNQPKNGHLLIINGIPLFDAKNVPDLPAKLKESLDVSSAEIKKIKSPQQKDFKRIFSLEQLKKIKQPLWASQQKQATPNIEILRRTPEKINQEFQAGFPLWSNGTENTDASNKKTENLPITLFADLGCPFCHRQFSEILKVRKVFPNLQFSLHFFKLEQNRPYLEDVEEYLMLLAEQRPLGEILSDFYQDFFPLSLRMLEKLEKKWPIPAKERHEKKSQLEKQLLSSAKYAKLLNIEGVPDIVIKQHIFRGFTPAADLIEWIESVEKKAQSKVSKKRDQKVFVYER